MSLDRSSPWTAFLAEVDRRLPRPVEIHCLGGFVAAMYYGGERSTNDLDYIEIIPRREREVLEELAGRESDLARKHHLSFQHVGIAIPPESYADRLTALWPGRFRKLGLFALDPHDLALSKLDRNSPVDREDVSRLAQTVPLDPVVLRTRYQNELRPLLTGDLDKHDRTLAMWIAAYFTQEQGS